MSGKRTELIQAVFNGEVEKVRKWISEGADINGISSLKHLFGQTPLWMAVGLAGKEISEN